MNIIVIIIALLLVLILTVSLVKLLVEHFSKGNYSVNIFLFTVGIIFLFVFLSFSSLYTGGIKLTLRI